MVDGVNPFSQSQNVLSVGKNQRYEDQKSAPTQSSAPQAADEVSLSDAAQQISDAQKSANEAYSFLSAHSDATLSADEGRLNTLV